jgi:hypothetical protein
MKLYALVDSNEDGSDSIVTIIESRQAVTDYFMEKIIRGYEQRSLDSEYNWQYRIGSWGSPKIHEVETGEYYSPYDFNSPQDSKQFLDMEHEIWEKIKAHNIYVVQNRDEITKRRKMVELEQKKQQIQKLKQEIEEFEH